MKVSTPFLFFLLFNLSSCYDTRQRYGGSSTSQISTTDVQEVTCTSVVPGRVQIVAQTFSPSSETIQQYEIVKWENHDSVPHTVTSGTTSAQELVFDMTLVPGQERCLRFLRIRSYPYFCRIHPEMRGEILVR